MPGTSLRSRKIGRCLLIPCQPQLPSWLSAVLASRWLFCVFPLYQSLALVLEESHALLSMQGPSWCKQSQLSLLQEKLLT